MPRPGRRPSGCHRRARRINIDDARIPDNAGAPPIDEPVVPGGPTAYLTTLPIKACVAAMREAGVPAAVSNTAGTFVCNHLAYGLGHLIATELPDVRGGFVHVPWAPEQVPEGTAAALEPAARGPRSAGAAARRGGHDTGPAGDGRSHALSVRP